MVALLDQLPEFAPAYLALVEAFDDDPGGPAVLTELADFVAACMTTVETDRSVLERALTTVETFAAQDGYVSELVGYAFLDSLSPDDRRRLAPWLGPCTSALLDELDIGTF